MGTAFLRIALASLVVLATGCGYEAVPISMELRASPSDGGLSIPFSLGGTSDPEASTFSTGIMLWTRWSTNRAGVRTIELFIDLNRDHLPAAIGVDDLPVDLSTDAQVVATLRGRDARGEVILEQQATSTQVEVDRLNDSGARELHRGTFTVVWPEGGPYLEIVGSWETLPRPPDTGTVSGGDFTPAPGDFRPAGDSTVVSGDQDIIAFDSSGCSCGGEIDEDIPEEPTDPEPAPEETTQDSGGCDCQGDNSSEPSTHSGSESDSSSEGDSGGCDCSGDSSPDEEATALGSSTRRVASVVRRCHRGPLRMGMELSPWLFVWALAVYRRRRRK